MFVINECTINNLKIGISLIFLSLVGFIINLSFSNTVNKKKQTMSHKIGMSAISICCFLFGLFVVANHQKWCMYY